MTGVCLALSQHECVRVRAPEAHKVGTDRTATSGPLHQHTAESGYRGLDTRYSDEPDMVVQLQKLRLERWDAVKHPKLTVLREVVCEELSSACTESSETLVVCGLGDGLADVSLHGEPAET